MSSTKISVGGGVRLKIKVAAPANRKRKAADDGTCAICLDTESYKRRRQMDPCGHFFHFVCLETWLQTRDTCPYCRTPGHSVKAKRVKL